MARARPALVADYCSQRNPAFGPRHAPLLPAGERAALGVGVGDVEGGEGLLDAVLHVVPAGVLEALLQPLEAGQQLLHGLVLGAPELLVDGGELGQDLLPPGEPLPNDLAGRERPVELRLLLEEADAAAGTQGHHALVRRVDPGEDPQQRRLAGGLTIRRGSCNMSDAMPPISVTAGHLRAGGCGDGTQDDPQDDSDELTNATSNDDLAKGA